MSCARDDENHPGTWRNVLEARAQGHCSTTPAPSSTSDMLVFFRSYHYKRFRGAQIMTTLQVWQWLTVISVMLLACTLLLLVAVVGGAL